MISAVTRMKLVLHVLETIKQLPQQQPAPGADQRPQPMPDDNPPRVLLHQPQPQQQQQQEQHSKAAARMDSRLGRTGCVVGNAYPRL